MSDKIKRILKMDDMRICYDVSSTKLKIRQNSIRYKRICINPMLECHLPFCLNQEILETYMGHISYHLNLRKQEGLPSYTMASIVKPED